MANSNDKPELHSAAKFPYYRQLKVRQGYYEYHYNGHTFREHRTPDTSTLYSAKRLLAGTGQSSNWYRGAGNDSLRPDNPVSIIQKLKQILLAAPAASLFPSKISI